ncbi:MAG: response regulator [Bdellovibrionales bacterium]|nr:response regulator [Bdellovibrionales bacterium]
MSENKPLICIVDDDTLQSEALADILISENFRVINFPSASAFLNAPESFPNYDLVISDINMPGASGFDLCRALRDSASLIRLPVILITGSDPSVDRVQGVEAGADEFIGKPFEVRHLLAKIRSLLSIREREVLRLKELETSKDLNIELGRFVSPNIARRLGFADHQGILRPHRAEVTVLFVDLRRFTAFSEKVEPEEVLEVLHDYYTAVGTAAVKYKGTLSHLAGDGIMVFFNDPEPVKDHREVAIHMALEAREALNQHKKIWDERNYDIDFGIGISEGYATIGGIGFEQFSQYTVIGTVSNFASRLSDVATDGQVLISHRFLSRVKNMDCVTMPLGQVNLKGIEKPVSIYNVLSVHGSARLAG